MINHIFVPDNAISKVECGELGVLHTAALFKTCHNVNACHNLCCLHCNKCRQLPVLNTNAGQLSSLLECKGLNHKGIRK